MERYVGRQPARELVSRWPESRHIKPVLRIPGLNRKRAEQARLLLYHRLPRVLGGEHVREEMLIVMSR
jgi:hypothetical protein